MSRHITNSDQQSGKTAMMEKLIADYIKKNPTTCVVTVRRGVTLVEKFIGSSAHKRIAARKAK